MKIFAVALLLLISLGVQADDTLPGDDKMRTSLVGLKAIAVGATYANALPDQSKAGLSRESIRLYAVEKLKSLGVPLVSWDEAKTPDTGRLLVGVEVLEAEQLVMYDGDIELDQVGTLQRLPNYRFPARTWWNSFRAFGSAEGLQVELGKYLVKFASDYRKANPKP